MEPTQINDMVNAMQQVNFAPDAWIIRQGESGNQLFVLEGGGLSNLIGGKPSKFRWQSSSYKGQ
jgi:hypothetical protein